MQDNAYLRVLENFISISLVSSDGSIIKDYLPDMESNVVHECECNICGNKLMVNEYLEGKLEETKEDNPTIYFKHKNC